MPDDFSGKIPFEDARGMHFPLCRLWKNYKEIGRTFKAA
jgi:hypothetical protein